jgi:hypothetical protein
MIPRRPGRAAQLRLEDLQRWCYNTGADLDRLTFDERRDVLKALNVKATVYRKEHSPRVVIDVEVPLAEGDMSSRPGHPEVQARLRWSGCAPTRRCCAG